ncbi:unnamed protein product [Staurois parvus]|uniref:Uncharacterized protein n=1 Tax=Staurois parvus TaxID=386267 RepID=A0ABN9B8F9_9NEOB|nr:unnamed protein product [Staurois parvus]
MPLWFQTEMVFLLLKLPMKTLRSMPCGLVSYLRLHWLLTREVNWDSPKTKVSSAIITHIR